MTNSIAKETIKKLLTQRKIDFGKANKRMLSSIGKGVEENLSNNAKNYRQC